MFLLLVLGNATFGQCAFLKHVCFFNVCLYIYIYILVVDIFRLFFNGFTILFNGRLVFVDGFPMHFSEKLFFSLVFSTAFDEKHIFVNGFLSFVNGALVFLFSAGFPRLSIKSCCFPGFSNGFQRNCRFSIAFQLFLMKGLFFQRSSNGLQWKAFFQWFPNGFLWKACFSMCFFRVCLKFCVGKVSSFVSCNGDFFYGFLIGIQFEIKGILTWRLPDMFLIDFWLKFNDKSKEFCL